MPSTIRVILSITCLAITTASCGGVKFSGESGQASGGSAEEPIDQPADVAGGLGLTCVPSANAVDASKTDFNCSFSDKSGKKFQERDDLKVDLQVKIGDQVISVTVSTANNVSSFSFTVEKTAVEKVQIATKFVNPKEGNKTLKDQTTELKTVIASPDNAGSSSNVCDLKRFQPSFISAIPGDGQVVLTWQPNGDAQPIQGYRLRYWEGDYVSNDPPVPPITVAKDFPPNFYRTRDDNIKTTTIAVTGLDNGKKYSFGILAVEPQRCGYGLETYISATPIVQSSTMRLQACPGSCYPAPNFAQDLPVGTERAGPAGMRGVVVMTLTYANGLDGFKIWKEKGGSRILNASGHISKGWQRKLESNGRLFETVSNSNSSYLTEFSSISGRVCPDYVFSRGASMDDQPCLYYTSDQTTSSQELNISKWNDPSTSEGGLLSWFESNVSLCGSIGMRLPTAYEVGATQIDGFDFMPSGTAPETPSSIETESKVPLIRSSALGMQVSKGIWTATGSARNENNYFALVPATTQTTSTPWRICANALNPNERCLMDFPKSDSRFGIRCVIPGF